MEQKVATRMIVKIVRPATSEPRALWRMDSETGLQFFVEQHLIPNKIIKSHGERTRSFWFAELVLPVPTNAMPFKLIKQAPWQDW